MEKALIDRKIKNIRRKPRLISKDAVIIPKKYKSGLFKVLRLETKMVRKLINRRAIVIAPAL